MTDEPILPLTTDFYTIFDDVQGADREWWEKAHSMRDEILPVINDYWEKAHYPLDIVKSMADKGLLTDGMDIDGFEQMSPLAAGLVTMELARTDLSMFTALAVQGGLALRSIHMWGSDEQKAEWEPKVVRAEVPAAFALTEPDHGSDSVALETTARRDGDDWVITGEKRWIGNGNTGGISVVWARMDDGQVGGFIVDQNLPGYQAETITGKNSLRCIPQAHIKLDGVRVPDSCRLPGATNFKAAAQVLFSTRSSCAWAALGSAIACYEAALEHATNRVQFGKTLVNFQLIQQRLVDMLQEITSMAMFCRQLAELQASGKLIEQQASMGKLHNTRAARRVASEARDMLGGSGILLENHVARHRSDLEAVHTFEGTDSVQSLILGKKITGVGAFK